MFTPPPSPLPAPRIILTTDESESESNSGYRSDIGEERERKSNSLQRTSSLSPSPTSERFSSREEKQRMKASQAEAQTASAEAIIRDFERKKRMARRTRWAVLLVPAVLVLVALTSRCASVSPPTFGIPDELEVPLGSDVDVGDGALLVPSEVGTGSVVVPNQGGSDQHDLTHPSRHVHKRQTLSLSNPAVPSSSILITPSDSPSSPSDSPPADSSPSNSESPAATTTVPQTEQTIPPVPDANNNPPTLPTPFPQPFDTTGATSNVTTQSCANFFTNMTQTLPFRSCRPFSLLEQSSSEFIEAQTNLTLLTTLLFGTCTTSTPASECVANMNWFASQLSSACSTELSQNNLLVTQTLLGLRSYGLLRQGACLVNQQSGRYCYAEAAHDASPADFYLYQLPLGIGFPTQTTQPSCSTCSKSLLGLFAEALRNGTADGGIGDGSDSGEGSKKGESGNGLEGLHETYEAAASAAESACGTGFATVGLATKGSASGATGGMVSLSRGRSAVVMVLGVLAGLLVGL